MNVRAAVLCALLVVGACGGGEPSNEAAPAGEAAPTPALVAPPAQSPLTITPRTGPPGTEVALVMSGLLMNQATEVGFGTFAGHEIIDTMRASASGDVSTTVRVPAGSVPGTYYFFVAEREGPPLAVSDSFVVTAAP